MEIFLRLLATINTCIILVISIYAFLPINSGHVGGEPLYMLLYFGEVALLMMFLALTSNEIKKATVRNIILAIGSMLLVTFFDVSNMLVKHERWGKRGLPDKGDMSWLYR